MTRIVLKADDGFLYTDGTVYAKMVYLHEGADPSVYKQVKVEEREENANEAEFR